MSFKKALAVSAAVAASLAGSLLTASGAQAATPSSAGHVVSPAYSANACRSWTTGKYAPVTDHIAIDSCYWVENNGYTVSASIPFQNYSGTSVVYCAHAINVSTGKWAHDFGCGSGVSTGDGSTVAGTGGGAAGYSEYWNAPAGTYVVSTGYWLNGKYYGDVQSPRTTIGAH
ncbi:hypothetical protein ABZ858_35980 [Streptomyces sp. NPDC047017]|uniref:hypothetical protein n=1 Tax=Streptomyces sp. NPDC047017 TaxID=3155024 RepID=UPI0033D49089